ncbi:hypothetical protein [Enterobacter hormaechei]|uniref:hypothetical protein n=1 Tax=Enterobacter hormaechei TaxID=158836 RepID=UPI001BD6191E|nr:hypothetical protein [Enterobacter hormaechei]
MRIKGLSLFFCAVCVGCSGYSQQQKHLDVPTYSESYDQALGWLVTARYRDAENAEIVMSLVGDFCRSKGKEATLYKTTAGSTTTTQEVWACQTPPQLNDTDILSGIYCHFIANAPRYSVDLSNRQKEVAEQKFVKAFAMKGIEYPVGGFYEKYKSRFSSWALAKHEDSNKTDIVLRWFNEYCH